MIGAGTIYHYYLPGAYYYNKARDLLKQIKWVNFKRYFDGDDWSWEEIPVFKVISNPEEKAKVLAERPDLLNG